MSPRAQQFVYDRWLTVMRARNINLTNVFGHDPETLAAAERNGWFIENTEPHESRTPAENMLNRIVSRAGQSRLDGNAKANLRTVPRF